MTSVRDWDVIWHGSPCGRPEPVRDPKMLQRFQDISVLPEKEKECLLTTVDHFIKSAKITAM